METKTCRSCKGVFVMPREALAWIRHQADEEDLPKERTR